MRMFSLYKESSEHKPVKICTIASAVGTGDNCLANSLQAHSSLPLAFPHSPSHRIPLTTLTSGVIEKSVHFCFFLTHCNTGNTITMAKVFSFFHFIVSLIALIHHANYSDFKSVDLALHTFSSYVLSIKILKSYLWFSL